MRGVYWFGAEGLEDDELPGYMTWRREKPKE
jgi:hypothetical protein